MRDCSSSKSWSLPEEEETDKLHHNLVSLAHYESHPFSSKVFKSFLIDFWIIKILEIYICGLQRTRARFIIYLLSAFVFAIVFVSIFEFVFVFYSKSIFVAGFLVKSGTRAPFVLSPSCYKLSATIHHFSCTPSPNRNKISWVHIFLCLNKNLS